MNIDDFPFDKFRRYRNEKLIRKVANHVRHRAKIQQILNIYAQLGMIDADAIRVHSNGLSDHDEVYNYSVVFINGRNVNTITIARPELSATELVAFYAVVLISIITIFLYV